MSTPPKTVAALSLATPPADSPPASLRYAWYVVFVLMACYTLSFIDRQILSLLVRPIKRDLALSDTQVGLLQGLAFALFYTFCGLPLGRIADAHSRRRLIQFGLFFFSLLTAACSLARSFGSLFAARMGVGVGEATLNPSAFSLITDYFDRRRLARAVSVYSMGIFIGSGLAFLVGGAVVDAVAKLQSVTLPLLGTLASWRVTFLIVGGPGLLMTLLLFSVREPQRRDLLRRHDGAVSRLSLPEVFSQLRLRWRAVAGLSLAMAAQSMTNYGFVAWAPTFFERVHGWSPGRAGRSLGLLLIFAGCAGMYAGGWLCDRWLARGHHEGPLRVGVVGTLGTAVFIAAALVLPDPRWTLALLAPGMFFMAVPVGSAFTSLQVILPNQLRGQVSALLNFILNLGGLTLGPLLPGVFTDYLFHNEKMVGVSVALTIALAGVASALLFRLTYRSYRAAYSLMHP